MTLREKLIVLRDKAGISQMSLAHQLDVSRQAVSRWESGDTTPSMDKLKALAKIYGVSLSCCTMLRGFIDRKNSCRSITARIIGVAGGYRHSLSNRG